MSIPKECKRLAEVDFPIAVVSKHSAREKSIRHGHPSTLHLWWARRPLAACRAILLGLLLPDPCDEHCPVEFKVKARGFLPQLTGQIGVKDYDLRQALLKFVGDFANWDNSAHPVYLEVGRGLVKAAHGEETPLVVDPFAGGGSIPLEALRLGCEAFASDLNPVACLILKVMLEDIPRHGPELAEELRRVGAEIKQAAEKELAEFYPPDSDGARPIAYLWARTVKCESPNCGAEIPLVRSFWLCKKPNRKRALQYKVVRQESKAPFVEFEIFEPKNEPEVPAGTVTRAKATCLCCKTVLPPDSVRTQLREQSGGADIIFDEQGRRIGGARLLAVVTLKPGEQGRRYRLPTEQDYKSIWMAMKWLEKVAVEPLTSGLSTIPNEPIDKWHHDVNRMPMYGMTQWGNLFTSRQKLALVMLMHSIIKEDSQDKANKPLSLTLTRVANAGCSLSRWNIIGEKIEGVYARQTLPMVWDFCEGNPFSDATGGYNGAVEWVARVIETFPDSPIGQSQVSDAAESPLPNNTTNIWFTDPPYYDAIDYAHCSDFFFVWLKRVLTGNHLLQDPFDLTNQLTPKEREVVVDSTTTKGHGVRTPEFYEKSMVRAFSEGRRVLKEDGVGCVVFAHNTTEGWEALLSGMIRGGWKITGSWPISTEMGSRLRARESAALATSVHLICRPRPNDAPVGDWGNVLRELPKRVGNWVERLQSEGIRGADLVFACIGPALEIFSQYSKVETAEGMEVGLPEFLQKVWEEIGRVALRQILGTDTPNEFGEDARLTALFLWTIRDSNGQSQMKISSMEEEEGDDEDIDDEEDADSSERKRARTFSGYTLPYDLVRRFSQPLGIHLERWQGSLIELQKGMVRLLPVKERAKQFLEKDVTQNLMEIKTFYKRKSKRQPSLPLFEELEITPEYEGHIAAKKQVEWATWSELHRDSISLLDHVHKAMIFQKQGNTTALRELLFWEQTHQPDFLRLANALSALYPKGSEEKRLVDAMLLGMPR